MPDIHEIIEQNNAATDFVVGAGGEFDNSTAELILRSSAVAADRLSLDQLRRLGQPAFDALFDAAAAAKDFAPLADADKRPLDGETYTDLLYRIKVWQPLHNLQSKVAHGEYDNDPQTVSKLQQAVRLGSIAFARILTDPEAGTFKDLQETIRYFGDNTRAAADRAERLRNAR